MAPHRVEVSIPMIVTDQGGFPVDNIAYWKYEKQRTDIGVQDMLVVQFKTGGFVHLHMTMEDFNSLVFGEPY